MPTFTRSALRSVAGLIVARMGSLPDETAEVADHLVRANLSGHDSHGVGMLPAYVRLLQDGLLVPNQTPQVLLDAGAVLMIDAGRGFGQRMAAEAVRRAIARARELGVCVLALRNSAHIGRVGTYGELATESGMAFTAYVNVADHGYAQAPWACGEARLGTNPFCAALPAADGALVLDMATTEIAFGKARVAFNQGMQVPPGAVIDADGCPTTDPGPLVRERAGALVSFGKHKGSGLAVLCEAMAAAVAGGQRADAPPRGGIVNSMLAIVIDLSRLGDPAAIADGVAASMSHIRAARLAPGFDAILLPGEPERRAAAERARTGIAVDEATWTDIAAAAARLGISGSELARASA